MDWQGFLRELCLYQRSIRVLFIVCLLGSLANLGAIATGVSPATQVIVVLNLVALVPLTAGTGFLTWKCSQLPG